MRRPSTDRRHFLIAGALVVIVGALMYWLLTLALPLPLQGSTQAVTIDTVFQAHMMLLAFLFALVIVLMIYAVVVFRRRKDEQDADGEHFEGNTTLEILWTVLPLIAVVIFGYIGVTSLNEVTAAAPDEMVIDVVGRQWSWSFTYEGAADPVVELVVPVNQPVRLEMTSPDVIHSFWVPEFRVKKDLVPGQTTTVRFTPTAEGEYSLVCAEICGLSHYNMVAPVRVVSEQEFALWQQAIVAGSADRETVLSAGGDLNN